VQDRGAPKVSGDCGKACANTRMCDVPVSPLAKASSGLKNSKQKAQGVPDSGRLVRSLAPGERAEGMSLEENLESQCQRSCVAGEHG
jgi:hypothetical protein